MAAKVNGTAIGVISVGLVFVYSGLKGYSIPQTIQSIVQGKSPANQVQVTGVGVPGTAASTSVLGVQSGALPSSGTYSTAQLEALWVQAGGSASGAKNAACHAMQESGGRPTVTSSNPDGGTNVGLWQLDTKGKGAGYSVSALQNALNNARITVFATNNGSNWSAWATPGC
jgi:hypothetical protein